MVATGEDFGVPFHPWRKGRKQKLCDDCCPTNSFLLDITQLEKEDKDLHKRVAPSRAATFDKYRTEDEEPAEAAATVLICV